MPMDRSLYPENWEAIALAVKESANWRCEECFRPCRKTGESFPAFLLRINWLFLDDDGDKPGRYVLTVAHLDHDPWNPNARLKALCAPCHGRYDLKALPTKQRLKRERLGQMTLFSDHAGQGKDFAKVQPTIFEGVDRHAQS